MISSLFFILTVKKTGYLQKILFFIPILYYLWSNDPVTYFDVYLRLNTATSPAEINVIESLIRLSNIMNVVIFTVYLISPFYILILYYKNTKIKLKKTYAIISAVCLTIMDIFIYVFFIMGPFSNVMFSKVDLLKFPVKQIYWDYYIIIPPLVMFVLLIIFYLTFYYKPFNTLTIISQRDIERNSKLLNKNLRMVFHVYKNLFFTLDKLAIQGENNIENNRDITVNNLKTISRVSQESVFNIGRILDMLRDVQLTYRYINIIQCLNEALEKVCVPAEVKIIKKYELNEILVYGDSFHLLEVFVNLFNNSLEAIAHKKDNDAFIEISVEWEEDLVNIEITDNGCGIAKKNIKNIYKPLFSTKQSTRNWGVGLNYVSKVLQLHRGHIYAKSELGKYTYFQVVLPLKEDRSIKKNEQNKVGNV